MRDRKCFGVQDYKQVGMCMKILEPEPELKKSIYTKDSW